MMKLKSINEERHYPKFLDELKETVIKDIMYKIGMTKNRNVTHFIYEIDVKSKYVDVIVIDMTFKYGENINDKQNYNAYYYNINNNLINGKLNKPQIIISLPFEGDITNYSILKYCISHELTHMYDDWMRLSKGKEGINYDDKNVSTTLFIQECMKNSTDFYKGAGGLCYMSLKVEKQAFLSQTIQELDALGCTPYNYREKIKETVLYNNLMKSYRMFTNGLNKCSNYDLINFNEFVFSNFPKANIPKYNIKNFQTNIYKQKLIEWGNNVKHKVMNSYNTVVSYYVDKMVTKLTENKCILIL